MTEDDELCEQELKRSGALCHPCKCGLRAEHKCKHYCPSCGWIWGRARTLPTKDEQKEAQ